MKDEIHSKGPASIKSRKFQSPTLFTQHRFTTRHHQHGKHVQRSWEEDRHKFKWLLFRFGLFLGFSLLMFCLLLFYQFCSANFFRVCFLFVGSSIIWVLLRPLCLFHWHLFLFLPSFVYESFALVFVLWNFISLCWSVLCLWLLFLFTIQKLARSNIMVFNIFILLPLTVYLLMC